MTTQPKSCTSGTKENIELSLDFLAEKSGLSVDQIKEKFQSEDQRELDLEEARDQLLNYLDKEAL